MEPILMPPNIIDHFYLGGERIAELRGVDMPSPRRPEEWLAATTFRAGEPGVGPTGHCRTQEPFTSESVCFLGI